MIEGDEFYEAVRFVFENQLMQAAEDTFFDTESGALVQDMAYALYVLGFGAAAPDADTARSDLGQYGIMSSCGNNEDALTAAAAQKGITDWHDLTPSEPGIFLWQGDITTLRCGAIVNAANSGMTGCWSPCQIGRAHV